MNLSKCPHCGRKLGDFMYADNCPHCQRELEHNNVTRLTQNAPKGVSRVESLFPVKLFRAFVRLVES